MSDSYGRSGTASVIFFFEQRWTVANRRDPIFDFFSQTNSAVRLSCSVKQSRPLRKRVNPSNKRGVTRSLSVKSKSTLCDFLDQKNNLYSFDTKICTVRSKFKIATNFTWRVGHGVHHGDSILPPPPPPHMTGRATGLIARDSLVCDMARRAYSPQLCVRYQIRP